MIRRHCPTRSRDRLSNRSAFTLLEVLLATVILASALTAVGQLAANGRSAALRAERESQAALICQSAMDEIVAGVTAVNNGQKFQRDIEGWTISTTFSDGPTPTLALIHVRVESAAGAQADFELHRIVPRKDSER